MHCTFWQTLHKRACKVGCSLTLCFLLLCVRLQTLWHISFCIYFFSFSLGKFGRPKVFDCPVNSRPFSTRSARQMAEMWRPIFGKWRNCCEKSKTVTYKRPWLSRYTTPTKESNRKRRKTCVVEWFISFYNVLEHNWDNFYAKRNLETLKFNWNLWEFDVEMRAAYRRKVDFIRYPIGLGIFF